MIKFDQQFNSINLIFNIDKIELHVVLSFAASQFTDICQK